MCVGGSSFKEWATCKLQAHQSQILHRSEPPTYLVVLWCLFEFIVLPAIPNENLGYQYVESMYLESAKRVSTYKEQRVLHPIQQLHRKTLSSARLG
jgi:hypothetical protein